MEPDSGPEHQTMISNKTVGVVLMWVRSGQSSLPPAMVWLGTSLSPCRLFECSHLFWQWKSLSAWPQAEPCQGTSRPENSILFPSTNVALASGKSSVQPIVFQKQETHSNLFGKVHIVDTVWLYFLQIASNFVPGLSRGSLNAVSKTQWVIVACPVFIHQTTVPALSSSTCFSTPLPILYIVPNQTVILWQILTDSECQTRQD